MAFLSLRSGLLGRILRSPCATGQGQPNRGAGNRYTASMVIPVEQAKAQLDALIDRSTAGEEIVITRNGRPVARMVAVGGTNGTNGAAPTHPEPRTLGS